MSDIADISSNAIIRPGKVPRWRAIGKVCALGYEMAVRAKHLGTFGAEIEVTLHDSTNCCGAIFFSEPDGGILSRQFWQLQYFFERDGAEALIFEYNRWHRNFVACRLHDLEARRKLSRL